MLTTSAIQRLKSVFRGELLADGDPGYDDARKVFNAAIDRRPGLIARCTGPDDVAEALSFARSQGWPVSVRGAGHNVAGFAICDDGIAIDLSAMKRIVVDETARTVRVEAGATWGEGARHGRGDDGG